MAVLFQSCVICLSVCNVAQTDREFFFKADTKGRYELSRMSCGKVRKEDRMRGHRNLMEHLTRDHKDFWTNFADETTTLFPFVARGKFPRTPKQFTVGLVGCLSDYLSTSVKKRHHEYTPT